MGAIGLDQEGANRESAERRRRLEGGLCSAFDGRLAPGGPGLLAALTDAATSPAHVRLLARRLAGKTGGPTSARAAHASEGPGAEASPAGCKRPIRVLIVDDIPEIRARLRQYLASDPDLCVAGEAGTGTDAIVQARRLSPDVVSMNINMPGMDGITATRRLTQRGCGARVVIVSVVVGEPWRMARAHEAGALICLEKPVERAEYVRAIKTAAREPVRRR